MSLINICPLNLPNSNRRCYPATALQIPVPALFRACLRLSWFAAWEKRLKVGGKAQAHAFLVIKAGAVWNSTTHSVLLSAWSSWPALVGLIWEHDCSTVIAAASCDEEEPSDNAFHATKTWGQFLKTFRNAKMWTGRNEILKIQRYLI